MGIEGVDLEQLARWMDAEGLGEGPLTALQPLSGGTQNILLRFTRSGRDYVLRRPPLHLRKNSNETMRREARVLAALKGSGVPHPGLIAACPEEDVLGATFYLMEPIDGFNPGAGPLPEPYASRREWRWAIGMQMVEGIARLGALDYRALGLEGLGKLDGYLERQVGRWAAQLKSYQELEGWPGPQEIPGVDKVADWLSRRIPQDFRPGVIHGDFHIQNVMFHHDRPELAAIIDWELTTLGDPLLDLGWLMATWPMPGEEGDQGEGTVATTPWEGFPEIEDLVARYGELSGRDLSDAKWYGVLGCYKLGIILEGTHARACAGKATREMGDFLHAKTVALFSRALRWVEA